MCDGACSRGVQAAIGNAKGRVAEIVEKMLPVSDEDLQVYWLENVDQAVADFRSAAMGDETTLAPHLEQLHKQLEDIQRSLFQSNQTKGREVCTDILKARYEPLDAKVRC